VRKRQRVESPAAAVDFVIEMGGGASSAAPKNDGGGSASSKSASSSISPASVLSVKDKLRAKELESQVFVLEERVSKDAARIRDLEARLRAAEAQVHAVAHGTASEAQDPSASQGLIANLSADQQECYAAIIKGKNRRDEKFLVEIFNRHKESIPHVEPIPEDDPESKAAFVYKEKKKGGLPAGKLVQALIDAHAAVIPQGEQEISQVMKQYDTSDNNMLEFLEFQQVVSMPDELEQWCTEKQLPLAADALRPLIGRGKDQLKMWSERSSSDIGHSAAAICAAIPGMLKELHQELVGAFAVQAEYLSEKLADPTNSKFSGFYSLSCGKIADFHKGLTGRIGMPNLDFFDAMRQEHCERAGFDVKFKTSNYGILTCPKSEWSYVVDNVACPDMLHNRRFVPISDLLLKRASHDAGLRREEVIAIVLYTGPMFQVYNTILRQYPPEDFKIYQDGDNLFTTTIFVLVSAIQKLCRLTRITEGMLLYRGLGGKADLPDIFFQPDQQGCTGYAEWGFLSTTCDRNVALDYSGKRQRLAKAMIMVIETSSIDRGADISEFSQYPGEQEYLFLPCSFIQRARRGNGIRYEVVDGCLVGVVAVRINLNIKTQTVEELLHQKQKLHLVSAKAMLQEVSFELKNWIASKDEHDLIPYIGDSSNFYEGIMAECKRIVTVHEKKKPSKYSNDETYRRLITEVLDCKINAIEATKWQETRMKLLSYDFGTAKVEARTLHEHSEDVCSVAFHFSEPILVTGSNDKTVKFWRFKHDNSSVTCVETIQAHRQSVNSVAFYSRRPMLATGSDDKTVKLWLLNNDFSGAKCVSTLKDHSESVIVVAFHSALPIFASASADNTVKLYLLNEEAPERMPECIATVTEEASVITCFAFHPSAPVFATGCRDSTVKLWEFRLDSRAVTCVATLEGHGEEAEEEEEEGGGGGDEEEDQEQEQEEEEEEEQEEQEQDEEGEGGEEDVGEGEFQEGEEDCYEEEEEKEEQESDDAGEESDYYDEEQDDYYEEEQEEEEEGTAENAGLVNCVAFHPTEPILASGSNDQTVKLWRLNSDCKGAKCFATLKTQAAPAAEQPSANKSMNAKQEWPGRVKSVSFHPKLPILASGCEDKTVQIWRLNPKDLFRGAKFVKLLKKHSNCVECVAFHPTAPFLASGGKDHNANLWR
jgi:WD40 repeat protein